MDKVDDPEIKGNTHVTIRTENDWFVVNNETDIDFYIVSKEQMDNYAKSHFNDHFVEAVISCLPDDKECCGYNDYADLLIERCEKYANNDKS